MLACNKRPIATMTRIESLSACHRLHNESLSEEENRAIFGKCNNPNGHGHNYKVEISLKGPVDPVTGMVFDLAKLKKIIEEKVSKVIDHKNIDKDIPYFHNVVSTTENVTIFIWQQVYPELSDILFEVKVHETDKNVFSYRGE